MSVIVLCLFVNYGYGTRFDNVDVLKDVRVLSSEEDVNDAVERFKSEYKEHVTYRIYRRSVQ